MGVDLHAELLGLKRSILEMGATVEDRVTRSLRGLMEHDIAAAEAVRHGDAEIDQMEIDNEAECLRLLALSHPVASDLRFVFAVLRINADLERMGDLAESIAKRALELHHTDERIAPPQALKQMASETQRMVADALEALADEDANRARQVRAADNRVDDLQKEIFTWVQSEIQAHVESTAPLIDLLSVARKLERIADHSTNVAENVIFLAEGRNVRHKSVEQVPSTGATAPSQSPAS